MGFFSFMSGMQLCHSKWWVTEREGGRGSDATMHSSNAMRAMSGIALFTPTFSQWFKMDSSQLESCIPSIRGFVLSFSYSESGWRVDHVTAGASTCILCSPGSFSATAGAIWPDAWRKPTSLSRWYDQPRLGAGPSSSTNLNVDFSRHKI
jgi:hypothetical protein